MIRPALLKKVTSILLTIGILSFALPGISFALANTGDLPSAKSTIAVGVDKDLQEEVLSTLLAYTQALSGDKKVSQTSLSAELNNLVNERQDFYRTFFQLGLHSTLMSIKSEYVFDTSDAGLPLHISVLSEKQIAVRVDEMVTLAGRYNAKPEEYPMNQAAQWALERTSNERLRQALKDYIQSATEDIMVSSGEQGFEVVFVLRHSLVMERNSEGLQIVKDAYTDISIDNTGIDNVIWLVLTDSGVNTAPPCRQRFSAFMW